MAAVEYAEDTRTRLLALPGFGRLIAQASSDARTQTSRVMRFHRRLAIAQAVLDAACLLVALATAHVIRYGVIPHPGEWPLVLLLAPPCWLATFAAFHLYERERLTSYEQFRNVIGAASVGIVAITVAGFWSNATISRGWLGVTWAIVLVLELAARRAFRRYTARLKAAGRLTLRTLIVGANDEAGRLAHELATAGLGFEPVGYVSTPSAPASANGIPVLGSLDHVERHIHSRRIDCLFVASSAVGADEMSVVAQAARRAGIEVRVSANLPQMATSRVTVRSMGDGITLAVRPVRLSGAQAAAKRAFDLIVASAVLVIGSPVLLGVALAIKVTSKGPVLFVQRRVTEHGRQFSIYKFRTMVVDGERVLAERGIDPASPFFKLEDDPRVTKVGRFIRRLSLDELPQLVNVIKGDMSLVGPRPLPVDQVAANLRLLIARHEVRAGVTGWWQIQGRSDVGPEDAVALDRFYIENWSLGLDLYILLKTVGVLIKRSGAY